MQGPKGGWSLPDVRGWATLGMFALMFFVLGLVAFVPSLAENELFKTLATLLAGTGGFGLVCAFLWGGSKASTHAAETVNDLAKANAAPQPTASLTLTTAGPPPPLSDEHKPPEKTP